MFLEEAGLQQEKIKDKEVDKRQVAEETRKKKQEAVESSEKLLTPRETEAGEGEKEGEERVKEDVESSTRHQT